MKSQEFIDLENRYGAHNYKPLDVVLSRGEGIWVWDVDGNKYMDCLSAYSAVNQGHCHPKIMGTMIEQSQILTLTSRAFRNNQLGLLYKELCDLTGMEMMIPMNSGAEAVETVIKTVRKWGYQIKGVPKEQAEIIVCENNFHGRTITIVGFSTDPKARDGFGPFTPGFKIIPFGDAEALETAEILAQFALTRMKLISSGGIAGGSRAESILTAELERRREEEARTDAPVPAAADSPPPEDDDVPF